MISLKGKIRHPEVYNLFLTIKSQKHLYLTLSHDALSSSKDRKKSHHLKAPINICPGSRVSH